MTIKPIFLVFVLAAATVLLPSRMSAQWTMCTGIPDTVRLRVPLKDGNRLLAGDRGGYYSSTDGHSWTKETPPTLPSSFYVADIYRFHRYLFAYSYNGIYKSADSGVTWQSSTSIYTYAMAGLGGTLLIKNNDNNFISHDTGATWISHGGGCGTYHINIYTNALLYPYQTLDSTVFLECGIFGIFKSIDSGNTFTDFGLNGLGTYNSFTRIDHKLFLAVDLSGSANNVYRSAGPPSAGWVPTVSNADGGFYWLSGTDNHVLLGNTRLLPYYTTNYMALAISWNLIDTTGLHLESYLTTGSYYSISYVKEYGDFLMLAVNYFSGTSMIPTKSLYFTRARSEVLPPITTGLTNTLGLQADFFVESVPADHRLKYALKLPVSSQVRISLTDISGTRSITVLDKVMDTESFGEYPLGELPAGMYLVTMETPYAKIVRRLIVMQ